jgi:hypothetical protein
LWIPPIIALIAAVGIVIVRLHRAAHGHLSLFILAEPPWANPSVLPHGFRLVANGMGYDGEFFYRLAINPTNLHHSAYGITFDNGFRPQRIGYPVLAYLFSFGQASLVPYALVAVNVVALGVLGLLGAIAAWDQRRHALWGLLIPGYCGFVFGVARDLAEPSAACFLVGGLLLLHRRRWLGAGLALAAGTLTRETVLVAAGAFALVRLGQWLTRRSRPGRQDLAWVLPAAAFVAWQATVKAVTGVLPLTQDSKANGAASKPGVALVDALERNFHHLGQQATDWWWLEMLLLALAVGGGLLGLRRSRADLWVKVALVAYTLEIISLSSLVWYGLADLRAMYEPWIAGLLVLYGTRRRLWPLAVLLCVVWPIIAVHRTLSL